MAYTDNLRVGDRVVVTGGSEHSGSRGKVVKIQGLLTKLYTVKLDNKGFSLEFSKDKLNKIW